MADLLERMSRRPWQKSIYLGEWVESSVVKPIVAPGLPNEQLGTAGYATPDDVDRATDIAKTAQESWAAIPPGERAAVMSRAAALFSEAADEFGWWLRRESGSTKKKTLFEIRGTAADFVDAAATALSFAGEILSAEGQVPRSEAYRVPIGVVGIITPWNSSMLLAARVIAPALALGNAVMLKPDPKTPVSGGALLAMVLEEAGVPAGVFQVLPGGADVGEALVRHNTVSKVSFTGSTAAGRVVGRIAGELLKPVGLELGGNNAFIVRRDATLELAAESGAFGSFFHQGQICFTSGRHLVHEDIADEYADLLVSAAKRLNVGSTLDDDTEIGPIISEQQLTRIHRIVTESIAQGAVLRTGGTFDGLYYEPTVLTNVTTSHAVFREETFGPVAPITTFSDDDEAIALAHDSEYGLVASVITKDLAAGIGIASKLNTAIVHINDQTIVRGGGAPIGGNGASGNGSRAGRLTNLDEWTHWKWLTYRADIARQTF